jgi:hypothetical protein
MFNYAKTLACFIFGATVYGIPVHQSSFVELDLFPVLCCTAVLMYYAEQLSFCVMLSVLLPNVLL